MRTAPLLCVVAAVACGGGKPAQKADQAIGTSHDTSDDGAATPADDGDTGSAEGSGGGSAAPTDRQPPETEPQPPATPASPMTFVLANKAKEDLVFSMDKGWQPVLFAYSGKPPKATPILMFAKWCTDSCDADEDARCPSCPEPEKAKEIAAAEKREIAPAGGQVEVPWDGQVFVYEKTRAGGHKCECWKRAEPPPGDYTVKACGFRVSNQPGKRSKLQCTETTMTLPLASTPTTITLEFPAAP